MGLELRNCCKIKNRATPRQSIGEAKPSLGRIGLTRRTGQGTWSDEGRISIIINAYYLEISGHFELTMIYVDLKMLL